MSAASSTDTLPGIRADYLDVEPLSPGVDALTAPSGITVVLNGNGDDGNVQTLLQNESRQTAPCPSSPMKKLSSKNGSSWRRKLMLRLRSSDFSGSLNNGEFLSTSTSPSSASESIAESSPSSRNPRTDEGQQGDNITATITLSPSVQINVAECPQVIAISVGDLPSLENGFSEPEEENEEDEEEEACPRTETEEGDSSLLSSPAAASRTIYYTSFLSVNAMRQETTSTSSPQLSSGASLHSSVESPLVDSSSYGEDSSPSVDSLKPEGLDASGGCLPAARSCPNLEQQSTGYSSASGSSSASPSPGPAGPRFKPLEEGDIQVCYLNHTKTFVKKVLSSKFLRRWETHHLYLNDACMSSKTVSVTTR